MKCSPLAMSLIVGAALVLGCQRPAPATPTDTPRAAPYGAESVGTGETPSSGIPSPAPPSPAPAPLPASPPAPTPATPPPPPVSTPSARPPAPPSPRPANRPPQIFGGVRAAPDRIVPGGKVQLGASFHDPDGDRLTFTWSQSPAQPPGELSSSVSASPVWIAPQVTEPTTFTLKATVDDGRGGQAQGQVQITVSPIAIPLAPQAASPTAVPLARQAFDFWTDPKEGAFKALVPSEWQVSGGLQRVNADPTYQLDVKKGKSHFFVQNPVPVQHWAPTRYTEMLGQREGTYTSAGGFQFFLLRYHPPRQYISNVLLGGLRQQYPDARIVEMVDLPELAKAYKDPAATLSEAASATLAFSDSGAPMKGGLTVMTDYYAGPEGSVVWIVKVIGVTAPDAELKQVARLLQISLGSLRIDPDWLKAETLGSDQRRGMFEATARRIRDMNYFIIREESRTTAHIGGNWADALGGRLWKDPEGNSLPDPGEGFDWGRDRAGKKIVIPKLSPLEPGEERFHQ